jgi:farnesyl diphosphate synthase
MRNAAPNLTAQVFALMARAMEQMTAPTDFDMALAGRARDVEECLQALLVSAPLDGEIARPEELMRAIRHGVLGGGKRLRPFLLLESAALFEADHVAALRVAAALECVHCYSLIHDDLPAMDDDDLRRGRPTVHRAFDEATAILAGDSLLTYAFDIVADEATDLPAEARAKLVLLLARAAGMGGMAGGQALDLQAERRRPDEPGIVTMQAMKTGALIRFACEAGAIIGAAGEAERERLAEFGQAVGLAFQLADDLLDATSNTDALGKAAGKDAQAGKATLVALHGIDWTRKQLSGLVEQASEVLEPFGDRAAMLRQAARFVALRSF